MYIIETAVSELNVMLYIISFYNAFKAATEKNSFHHKVKVNGRQTHTHTHPTDKPTDTQTDTQLNGQGLEPAFEAASLAVENQLLAGGTIC